ncbi:hypothetical protein [Martelella sp. AD-3]|uniref:hypothetical protein n=1 Tax=Martelella sp. AD-3 TaxID=686597 RepID=UPI0012696490|nr:hypothetical protein [Martelella sp. AD-3]
MVTTIKAAADICQSSCLKNPKAPQRRVMLQQEYGQIRPDKAGPAQEIKENMPKGIAALENARNGKRSGQRALPAMRS